MANNGPKLKRKRSIEFLIPHEQRQSFIAHIINDINLETIQNTGTVYKLSAPSSTISYHIVVSKNSLTGELQFHGYDPKFEKLKLGKGAQGEVVIAQDLISGALVAVKCQQTNGFNDDVISERENLLRVQELIGSAKDEEGIEYTVMEYNRGFNLLDVLYEKDKIQDRESIQYFASKKKLNLTEKAGLICLALEAMIWLHSEIGLAHRDIKPDNLVLIQRITGNILKFVDFGSAIDPKTMTAKNIALFKLFVGTFGYAPSELIAEKSERKPYSFASDIFVLGIVMAEILTCYNYQAALREHRAQQRAKDTAEELSLDEIKKMMPDAFKCENMPASQSEEKLLEELLSLILICTNPNPDLRPNIDILKKTQPRLARQIDQLKMIQQVPSRDRIERYKALKRQNSVLLLESTPKAEEKSAPIQTDDEKPKKSDKKLSTAGKRDLLTRSVTVSKLKDDKIKKPRKSNPDKPITTQEDKDKPSKKAEDGLKKRSISSVSKPKKEPHAAVATSSNNTTPLPIEADIVEKLRTLSLEEVKETAEDEQLSSSSVESDPEVIGATLDMLQQRLSASISALSQSAIPQNVVSPVLQHKDTMVVGVLLNKLKHVRQSSSSGDRKAFKESLHELNSLSGLVKPGSALSDKAEAVKSTCAKLLKSSSD